MMNTIKIPETLFGLVQNYGPSGAEQKAVNFLLQHMKTLGFSEVKQDKAGNAIGSFGEGPKTAGSAGAYRYGAG